MEKFTWDRRVDAKRVCFGNKKNMKQQKRSKSADMSKLADILAKVEKACKTIADGRYYRPKHIVREGTRGDWEYDHQVAIWRRN